MEKFYLTTAIPYVNAKPHIGHTFEFIQADVIKRSQSLFGKETFLTTGADENSLKNVQAAEKLGISIQQLCDENGQRFRELAYKIGLSYDEFKKSSSRKDHWPGAQKLWELCNKRGDIYKKKYKGLYCVGCEAFYKENELSNGLCKEHNIKPEEVEEENYFFKLSKYQEKLEELIENDEVKIYPESRKNETLSFIKAGLEDFSISRSRARAKNWGVPVPGDENQIMYVWFDALSCYITGVGYDFDEKKFKKWWPCDLHVIGKGIIRFHAVYWIAMLLSAGLKLPKGIFVHGYITVEGQKMSKSLGNVLDPMMLIDKYGSDQLRYYLMAEVPTFDDGDFSEVKLVERINNELVANLGNLVNRTLVFIKNNFDSKVYLTKELSENDKKFIEEQERLKEEILQMLEKYEINPALHKIMAFSSNANKYFQDNAPWKSIKEDKQRCSTVISILLHQVKDLAILLEPYLPKTSRDIFMQLAIEPRKWDDLGKLSIKEGHRIGVPKILFKKIEQKEIATLQARYSGKQTDKTPEIRFSDFDIEVGEIIEVQRHPDAEKLFVEKVQLGDGVRQLVSGLAGHYFPEQLLHKKVLVVRNLKPALLRGVQSNGMLLAAENKEGRLEVISLKKSKVGEKVSLAGQVQKPKPEISITDFFKVEIKVENLKVLAEGKQLATETEEVKTEEVIDGKVV